MKNLEELISGCKQTSKEIDIMISEIKILYSVVKIISNKL